MHGENSWRLSWLLTEKFSNRLYITFFFYIFIPSAYFWIKRKRETLNPKPSNLKTITVKNGRKSIFVEVDSIEWISSDGPYILLHTAAKRHLIHNSLKNIITTLPDNFRRIHRSTIVNINMIKELKSRMNGDYDVIMNDNTLLRLSRNYTKGLKGTLL
ncbi:MAG TPA: LytTR family DNA-binding domain-containing protein [Flavobacteriaceae bacterium]|nr:LytTR family DNA-binding domain-containing protein [Flavobacteriaceae bacterium]